MGQKGFLAKILSDRNDIMGCEAIHGVYSLSFPSIIGTGAAAGNAKDHCFPVFHVPKKGSRSFCSSGSTHGLKRLYEN